MRGMPFIPGPFLAAALGWLVAAHASAQVPDAAPAGAESPKISLGIRVYPVDNPRAKALGVTAAAGAVIGVVRPDSLAEQAGLKVGDVVVEFAGRRIGSCDDLEAVVKQLAAGETYRVEFYRGRRLFFVDINTAPAAPPEEWVSKQVGDLMIELPAAWQAMQQLPVDEGIWTQNEAGGTQAFFAVVRDLTAEVLCDAMKVEEQKKTTLAGRPAESFLGTIDRGDQTDRRRVIVVEQGESAARPTALVFVAPADRWPAVTPAFDRILASVRPAAGPPPPSPPVLAPGKLVIAIGDLDQ
jgi:membrane-associated protease RseP (regulator of RpoE activity)